MDEKYLLTRVEITPKNQGYIAGQCFPTVKEAERFPSVIPETIKSLMEGDIKEIINLLKTQRLEAKFDYMATTRMEDDGGCQVWYRDGNG